MQYAMVSGKHEPHGIKASEITIALSLLKFKAIMSIIFLSFLTTVLIFAIGGALAQMLGMCDE